MSRPRKMRGSKDPTTYFNKAIVALAPLFFASRENRERRPHHTVSQENKETDERPTPTPPSTLTGHTVDSNQLHH